MTYGIEEKSLEILKNYFSQQKNIEKVLLFGSRAKGNFTKGSDVDLALITKNDEKISLDDLSRIKSQINDELPLPYFFDVLDFSSVMEKELRGEIEQYGKIIFEK